MDADGRSQKIIEILRQRGIRLTPQRKEIIRILCRQSHPGAGEILERAREKIPGISTSTVYYTISLLKKEELIKELEFYDMENRYESELADHIDLICTKCGEITNFKDNTTTTRSVIEESTGFRPHRMRFEYYGTCARCRNKKE